MGAKETVDRVFEELKWARLRVMAGEPVQAKHVVVIPAYREQPEEVADMLASIKDDGVLVLFVINDNHLSPRAGYNENMALFDALAEHELVAKGQMVVLHGMVNAMVGVGGARHVGAEIARAFQREGVVESQWIHASDSDSLFYPSYFEEAEALWKPDSALCVHQLGHYGGDEPSRQAAAVINSCLMLTLLNLQKANTPYAMTASGVGVAISAKAHDSVGGWPKMSMAEDMWIIKRAGKYGRIHRVLDKRILTSCRPESRAIARPGEDEDTAGHGDAIAQCAAVMAKNDGKVLTISLEAWAAFQSIYEVINGFIDKSLACDFETAFIQSAEKHGVQEKNIIFVLEAVRDVVPLALLQNASSRNNFYFNFDMKAQQDLSDHLCLNIPHAMADTCVNDSEWGVKHEGDWVETEKKLHEVVLQKCFGDVGLLERVGERDAVG